MNWMDRLSAWVKSWEGILTLLGAIGAAYAATHKMVATVLSRIVSLVRFYLNGDKHHADVVERLNALDRGQLDIIQTRAAIMDADEQSAFFRCDAKGQCVWVSELWRKFTGLSSEESTGYGWEMGVEEADRPRVLQNWEMAVAHSRRYEDQVTYCDRRTAKVTKAKVVATPVKDPKDGTVLGWNGIAKPL